MPIYFLYFKNYHKTNSMIQKLTINFVNKLKFLNNLKIDDLIIFDEYSNTIYLNS